MLAGHGLELEQQELKTLMGPRATDELFTSLAVRAPEGCLSIVYKAAAEIGELGDNVAALRSALAGDPLLAKALASPDIKATVVGHTRWASVGLISQANAHPLNSDEANDEGARRTSMRPYVVGALNGDIDNYSELVVNAGVSVPDGVTTDAKLVPTVFSRQLAAGPDVGEAFRRAVGRFDGSVGIAANSARAPE